VSLGAARALGVSLNGSTGRVAFPNSSQFSLTGAISMEAGLKATSTAVTRVWDLHGSGGFTVWKPQIVSCQELRDLAAPAAMFRAAGHPDCWGRSPMEESTQSKYCPNISTASWYLSSERHRQVVFAFVSRAAGGVPFQKAGSSPNSKREAT
jgi:hypothetical protein